MKYLYPSVPNRLDILSSYFTEIDNNTDWIGEVKKNGWRCEAYRDNNKLTLWTRRHTIITDTLPTLRIELFNMIPEMTIIDGELLEKRTKKVKELFYAFDILVYRNVPVFKYPWHERRLLLEHVIKPIPGLIELSDPVTMNKKSLYYNNIGTDDVEGIVLKKVDSPHMIGLKDCVDNPWWLKVKKA